MKKTICAGGFISKDHLFLFGKRSLEKKWAPGVWDIVGGHALKHEQSIDTLKRETLEEFGITVTEATFIDSFNVPDESKAGFFEYHVFWIINYEGEPENCSDEHSEIKWLTREELGTIELAHPSYLTIIDIWLSNATSV